MTEFVQEMLETQAALDDLAARVSPSASDDILDALGAWAAEIDREPLPEFPDLMSVWTSQPSGRAWRVGVALAAALAMSSSGVAAAVTGDPLRPFGFVLKTIYQVGHNDKQMDRQPQLGVGTDRGISGPDTEPDRGVTRDPRGMFLPTAPASLANPTTRSLSIAAQGGGAVRVSEPRGALLPSRLLDLTLADHQGQLSVREPPPDTTAPQVTLEPTLQPTPEPTLEPRPEPTLEPTPTRGAERTVPPTSAPSPSYRSIPFPGSPPRSAPYPRRPAPLPGPGPHPAPGPWPIVPQPQPLPLPQPEPGPAPGPSEPPSPPTTPPTPSPPPAPEPTEGPPTPSPPTPPTPPSSPSTPTPPASPPSNAG